MDHIPISFDYSDKHYEGTLDEVSGAAARTWHLMINNCYRGQLSHLNDKFVFYSNDKMFQELAGYFGEIVTLWYE